MEGEMAGGLLGHSDKGVHFHGWAAELLQGEWDIASMEVDMKDNALFLQDHRGPTKEVPQRFLNGVRGINFGISRKHDE
jgi:hypothetical protein